MWESQFDIQPVSAVDERGAVEADLRKTTSSTPVSLHREDKRPKAVAGEAASKRSGERAFRCADSAVVKDLGFLPVEGRTSPAIAKLGP